jgi:hypothetical protein
MCISPIMRVRESKGKLFLPLHFSNWHSSDGCVYMWIDAMEYEDGSSKKMCSATATAAAVMGIFSAL